MGEGRFSLVSCRRQFSDDEEIKSLCEPLLECTETSSSYFSGCCIFSILPPSSAFLISATEAARVSPSIVYP